MIDSHESSYRWHSIQVIQERSSQSRLWGMGVFATMAIAFLISSILLVNSIRYTELNLVMIEDQPLLIPIFVAGILVALYLAMLAAISVSRELDTGTLETLLYGPVDEISFILGTFLAHVKVFFYTLVVALIWSNFCVWILNLSFKLDVLGLLLVSFMMATELFAFVVFSAIWGGKARNALIYFILIIVFIGGVQVADLVISGLVQINTATISDPMILVRNILAKAAGFTSWISPFTQAQRAMQAMVGHVYGDFFRNLGLMLMECGVLIAGAILLFKKKGVR